MDPTKVLEADHRSVESLFEAIKKAKGDARSPLIEELVTSLRGHMELEESVLYPRIGSITGEESVQEADTEHKLARKTIEDVVQLAPAKPGFEGALESLKAGVMHHVQDEEGKVFPQLRTKARSLLEELSAPFMKKRTELGLPMDVDAVAMVFTKDELLNEAKTAGIEGTSSMTKDQLAEALVESMA